MQSKAERRTCDDNYVRLILSQPSSHRRTPQREIEELLKKGIQSRIPKRCVDDMVSVNCGTGVILRLSKTVSFSVIASLVVEKLFKCSKNTLGNKTVDDFRSCEDKAVELSKFQGIPS